MDERFTRQGVFSWCELMTTDVAAAKAFYGKLLGWKMEDLPMEGMVYTVLKVGDQEVGGIMGMPPQAAGAPPGWGVYVTVSDVDVTASQAEILGAKIVVPPTDIPEVGRFCVLQDPQGAHLSLITYFDSAA
jgi:hypothetical protein